MMSKPLPPDQPAPEPDASTLVGGGLWQPDGHIRQTSWDIPVEVPVALNINTDAYAVMLCTPQDLHDFARGFILSEAILPGPEAIQAITIDQREQGIQIDIQARASSIARQALRQRKLAGRSGCGLCGVQSLHDTLRPMPRLPDRPGISPQAVLRGFAQLPANQPIKQCNRSVHGAAWCDAEGNILLSREDVGRHNALDKLIGALSVSGFDRADGFVVLSSRCSYELVQKAASVGIPALATLSAPTSLALNLARQANLQLSAKCGDGVIHFNQHSTKS